MRILLIFFIFIHFFINALTWDYYTISATDKNSSTPQISFNDDNEGFAIYGYNSQILVSKYDTTFENPSVISGALTTLSYPQISRNTSDEAAAVWVGPGYIYQSTFDSSDWSSPTSISQHTGFDTYTPSSAGVSMNDDGDAIAVWDFHGMSFPFPEKYSIQFSKFISPNWSSYSDIISSEGFIIYENPRVNYNDSGNGMVVFWDDYNIKASYYNGSSWSTLGTISDGGVVSILPI